ncbi:MAG: methyltransferase domain-containing protein [Candidatus Thorarchaeota archaeon]|jgi:2-polyprenyl-3-methyl-5-hydroxy-6-metoxy-1,4-benzoquinol methylase
MIEPAGDARSIWDDPDTMLEEWENSENKRLIEELVAEWVIDEYKGLGPSMDYPIADLGCGNGRLAQELDLDPNEYYGFDASQAMIARARERCPVYSFSMVDIFNYSSDRHYDTVVLMDVAYHQNLPIEAVMRVMQLWTAEYYVYTLLVGVEREELLVSTVEPLTSLFDLLDKVELDNCI